MKLSVLAYSFLKESPPKFDLTDSCYDLHGAKIGDSYCRYCGKYLIQDNRVSEHNVSRQALEQFPRIQETSFGNTKAGIPDLIFQGVPISTCYFGQNSQPTFVRIHGIEQLCDNKVLKEQFAKEGASSPDSIGFYLIHEGAT